MEIKVCCILIKNVNNYKEIRNQIDFNITRIYSKNDIRIICRDSEKILNFFNKIKYKYDNIKFITISADIRDFQ